MNDWIYFEKKIPFTKNKYVNFQIGCHRTFTDIFSFHFLLTRKIDHAGLDYHFSCCKFYIVFQIYDNRHWCELCGKFKDETCYSENHEEVFYHGEN